MTATALSADELRLPDFDFDQVALANVFELTSHERAREAIDLGLATPGQHYNMYVLGPDQAGRMTATRAYVERWASTQGAVADWVYLQNFASPGAPRPLALPAGMGARFKRLIDQLIPALARELAAAFASEDYQRRVQQLRSRGDEEIRTRSEQLEARARELGLALVATPQGPIIGAIDEAGQTVPLESLAADVRERLLADSVEIRDALGEIQRDAMRFQAQHVEAVAALEQSVAAHASGGLIDKVSNDFASESALVAWLSAMKTDLATHFELFLRVNQGVPVADPARALNRYAVNLLVDRASASERPVVVEQNPTYENLFGRIEYRQVAGGGLETDVSLIKAGSLHRANGGVLILRAADIAPQPLLWGFLKAALRDGEIRIEEFYRAGSPPLAGAPQPVPVPLNIKVILVGPPSWYYGYFAHDPEFSADFKIRAHIDPTVDATRPNLSRYAALLADHARKLERVLDSQAIARLLSVASRWAGDRERLTSSYEMLCALIEEATSDDSGRVSREAVDHAVRTRRRRNSQIEDQVHRAILEKMTIIAVEGSTVGQINGLTVQQVGDHVFGTPARITARSSVGRRGVISIERMVAMSGPIQQKGSMVLQGLLARRFARSAPTSFDCSVTFEQLYGGVEGDSASMAEYVAIISDLADTPIRQDVAITGSVNQLGEAQVIGGVHHKIEGFFRTCREHGELTGTQGVVLPAGNRRHLVLRDEVADAVADGRFQIWTVDSVDEAVVLLTGLESGLGADGTIDPEADTVYARVLATLRQFDEALARRHL